MIRNYFGNKYPYTDFHELNLDWILSVINDLREAMKVFVEYNEIKYADPILWDITTQYQQNTIVQDPQGNTYLSKVPVPAGIALTNTDYWLKVADFDATAGLIRRAISFNNDGASPISSANRAIGDLVWWNNILYEVIQPITAGSAYDATGATPNISAISLEQLISGLDGRVTQNATDISSIDGRVTQNETDITDIYTRLNNIKTIYYDVTKYGATGDGSTDDSTAINAAIADAYAHGGGVVYFPNGTYKVDSAIEGKSRVSLLGEEGSSIDITDVPEETDLNYGHHIGVYYKGSKTSIGAVTADLNVGTYSCSISRASNLASGDWIELVSTTDIIPYQIDGTGPYKAEIFKIISISGATITLDHAACSSFTAAEGVTVYKIDMCENFSITNIKVVSNAGPAADIDGIYLWLCNKATVSKCRIIGVDWYSIGVVESVNIEVIDNFISGEWFDGVTGSIFFGVAVLNASQWVNVIGNHAEKVRHLYVNTSYFNTQIVAGIPRFINVIGNVATNMMASGAGSSYAYQHHGSGSDINIIGNIADSCYAGVSVEGSNVNVVGNIIKNAKYHGILIGNGLVVKNINVANNQIGKLTTNTTTSSSGEPCGGVVINNRQVAYKISDIKVSGNQIEYDAQYSFGIDCGSGNIENVDISDNQLTDVGSAVSFGSIRSYGTNVSVRNNHIKSQYGIVAGSLKSRIINNYIKSRNLTGSYRGIDAGWSNCILNGNTVEDFTTGVLVDSTCPVINNAILGCTTPIQGTPTVNQNNYIA